MSTDAADAADADDVLDDVDDVAREAWTAAAAAQESAGIRVREAESVAEMGVVRRVFDTVWDADPTNPAATVELLRAYAHTGQYVVLVEDLRGAEPFPGNVIAASVGFLAAPVGRALHSNVTGVLAASGPGRAVGFAVKVHQRAWALAHGLDVVSWTYDPLIRRNAWFNLGKLAARPMSYLVDFYGAMADGINAGDESDRLYVHWRLRDPAAAQASAGRPRVLDVDALRTAGAAVLVEVGPDGGPLTSRTTSPRESDVRLVQVPADIERLRGDDPGQARAWRSAVREALHGSMSQGWQVLGVGRDGWYVLGQEGS